MHAFVPAWLQVGAALAELLTDGVVSREQLFITGKLWNSSHAPKDVQPALTKTLQDLGVSTVVCQHGR
jgi:alcohol dehydrogenase (NADP+)